MTRGTTLPDLPPQTPQPSPGNVRPGRGSIRRGALAGQVESADGKILPIPYGLNWLDGRAGPVRVLGGSDNRLVASYFYSIGQINAIKRVYIDNQTSSIWNDGAHGSTLTVNFPQQSSLDMLRMTQYHGTKTQIVDPTLAGYFPGYADTNIYQESGQAVGQVYIVCIQRGPGFENVVVPRIVVEGLQIYDPRTTLTAYSTNPALFLADFLTQPYGAGEQIDWDSVIVAADHCDELVNGKPRFFGGAVITDTAEVDRHIERLRAIAGCMVRVEGSTIYLVKNAPAASVFTFKTGDIVDGSLVFSAKQNLEAPTRVEVDYTKVSESAVELIPWERKTAVYEDPDVALLNKPRRTTKIQLWDAQSHEVAYRYALQEYRQANLAKYQCRLQSRDMVAATFQGEVVLVNHDDLIGSSMAFRVTRVRENRTARGTIYNVELDQYDGDVYSNDDVLDPGPTFPLNVDPDNPPPVEVVEAEEIIGPDQIGVIKSRVQVLIEPIEWPAVKHYEITLVGPNVKDRWIEPPTVRDIVTVSSDLSNAEISDSTNGELFVVNVRVISVTDAASDAAQAAVQVFGRYAPPPDISHFITLAHVQGRTFIVVAPVQDIGRVRYWARYSPSTDVGWDAALPINDAPTLESKIVHDGFADETSETIWYYVKAVDDVGVESVNALKGKVTTDPQLSDEFREVAFNFNYDSVINGQDFFLEGKGNARAKYGRLLTWDNRLGTTDIPVRLINSPWYDGTGILFADDPGWPEGDINAFDLGTEKVRRVAADAEWSTHRAGFGEVYDIVISCKPFTSSDLYGNFVGPDNGNITRSMRRASFSFSRAGVLLVDEYAEIYLPVTVVARKILHDQGGNVFDLGQVDLPYQVTFNDPYSMEPLLQVTHVSDKSNNIFAVSNLTATGFEFDRISGGGGVTWSMSWRAIGD